VPNLPTLLGRVKIPFVLTVVGLGIFWLASVVDLSRALDQSETLIVVLKRTIGVGTFVILLVLLNARLVSIERLLDVYCVSAAVFLSFVAYMSIVVHGLPYVIPDPLYAQTYNKNQVAVLAVFSFACALYLCLKSLTPLRLCSIILILLVIFLTYSRVS